MAWHQPLSRYAPFSLRGIYTVKVAVSTALLLWIINVLKLPSGSGLICIAPMMMVAADRLVVRDIPLQVSIGFTFGVIFACVLVNWIGPDWPIALTVMCLWAAFFIYLGETASILSIPCRIIGIMPAILFNVAGTGQLSSLSGITELLLMLSYLGIWGFYLLDHVLFPLQHNYPKRPPIQQIIREYLQTLHFSSVFLEVALKTMSAILFIMGTAYVFGFPNASMVTTALISCVVVSTTLLDKLKQNVRYRVLGNIIGGVWGIVCLVLLSDFSFTWLMMAIVVLSISFFAYLSQMRLAWMGLFTQAVYAFIAVVDPAMAYTNTLTPGLTRFGGVLYGCLVVYGMHLLFSVIRRREQAHQPLQMS